MIVRGWRSRRPSEQSGVVARLGASSGVGRATRAAIRGRRGGGSCAVGADVAVGAERRRPGRHRSTAVPVHSPTASIGRWSRCGRCRAARWTTLAIGVKSRTKYDARPVTSSRAGERREQPVGRRRIAVEAV